ncbi:MAG: nucleotidyltransferase domain-containing protein [Chitinophagaceae bacterium]
MGKDKNKHLKCVLKSHNIENNESLMTAYRAKRDEVREDMKERYKGRIYRIIHSGSYKKGTAVNIKFDMDIVIPFKKNEDTLENLYNDLYDYFDKEYRNKDNSLLSVKKQKVAIGLEFWVDGHTLDLDIVPGREIDDYEEDGDLNLYVNEQMGSFKKSSYIKTNIQKQIDHIRDTSEARDVIKELKVWKRRNNGQIKSFVIELISIKALDGYKGDNDPWSKLKYVLEYIRDNIKTVSLVDPGNSNNIVSETLESYQKDSISDTMKWMLQNIEANDQRIEDYFPVNSEFPCEDDKASAYVVGGAVKPDRLNNEDFG